MCGRGVGDNLRVRRDSRSVAEAYGYDCVQRAHLILEGGRDAALNPPETPALRGVDYNVKQNGPEFWLPVVSRALAP
jgi:hypothetical protein